MVKRVKALFSPALPMAVWLSGLSMATVASSSGTFDLRVVSDASVVASGTSGVFRIGGGISADDFSTTTVDGRTWAYKALNDGEAAVTGVSPATGTLAIPPTIAGRRVTRIGAYAFRGCAGLTSVSIPSDVRIVAHGAFEGCAGLETATFADGVEEIWGFAFGGCASLRTVRLPASVSGVFWAFKDCGALESIEVDPANARYKSENGMLLSKDGRTLWEGVNGDVRIPDGVARIAGGAFSGRIGLKSVAFSAGVPEIGEGAFEGCRALECATFLDSASADKAAAALPPECNLRVISN